MGNITSNIFVKKIKIVCFLIIIPIIIVTCTKTTVINNYITNPSDYKTGLIPTASGAYSNLPVASIPTGTLQSSFSLQIPSHPFDQGNLGSCGSCASAMAKSILDHTKYNIPYPGDNIIFSPSFLYDQVKTSNDCLSGSYLPDNLSKIQSAGICTETDMPYNPFSCSLLPTSAQFSLASTNKIESYQTVPSDRLSIKQIINSGCPVIVGFYVDNTFFGFTSSSAPWSTFSGYVQNPNGTNAYHATLLYGWDDSKGAFKMLNQYGSTWGDNGSIWVTYNLIENHNVFVEFYQMKDAISSNSNNLTITGDLNFGNVAVNSSSTKIIQLKNTGTSNITVSSIGITAPFMSSWSSGTLVPNATQSISITFSPMNVGVFNSSLTVNSNAANSPGTIQATGNGTQSVTQTKIISLSGNLAFGNVSVGQTASQILTISNTGNSPLVISALSSSQPGFSCNYSGTIQPNSNISATVFFSPVNTQQYNSIITVFSDATSGNNTIGSSGTGVSGSSYPNVNPPLGTYGNCNNIGSYSCGGPTSYGTGIINARVVSLNTANHTIVIEIKKCDGSAFQAAGTLNIVPDLCTSSNYYSGQFPAGYTAVQTMQFVDNNMTGTKVYSAYIYQTVGANTYFYSAPPIIVNY